MSASGQAVPGRLNISASVPMVNIPMASAISMNRLRRLSGSLSSLAIACSAALMSSVSTGRLSLTHSSAALRMHWRMALRSARVRRASSLDSPPVIINRAVISSSPKISRCSSSIPARASAKCWSEASTSAAFRTLTWSLFLTSCTASTNGARLTPLPGASRTRFTVRPSRLAKSPSRPKLLPASMMKNLGR